MERVAQLQDLLVRSKRLPWLIVGLTLLILGATIFFGREQLAERMRAQLISRDGEILYAVALMHLEELEEDVATDDVFGGIGSTENLLTVLLKTTRLKGVLAARLFDNGGRFLEAFPADVSESELFAGDVERLKRWNPVSRFRDQGRLSDTFMTALPESQPVPLLEVIVPLHTRQKQTLLGAGQFIIEGQSLATQFAQLDRNLARQAIAAFSVSGTLLVASLLWAFRRLRQSHRLLEERTETLMRANQELALVAKTSAMGAVTSHLIHGLKSPLSGLQSFVNSLDPAKSGASEADWQQASAITRRMQTLINQVVSVLREEQGFRQYELTLGDLQTILLARMEPLARQKGVHLVARIEAPTTPLPNRAANLVTLILMNLVQNAIEATPAEKSVSISAVRVADKLVCEVTDQGPGLPEPVRSSLFSPCHSTKEQGSGIGLAISKQLASHLGAELDLKSTSESGCVFHLSLPIGS